MWPTASAARWRWATRWPSWFPPWPAPPTNWSAGARRSRRCTTRANTMPWWRPASRSPPGWSPSPCRRWGWRRDPGPAGRYRCAPMTPMAQPASSASTPATLSRAWSAGRSLSSPASRGWRPTTGSRRSVVAVRTHRRSHWPPPCAPTAATSTPTWTASIPPIRAWCRGHASWTGSPTRRCWNWPPSVPRCCRRAASSWR